MSVETLLNTKWSWNFENDLGELHGSSTSTTKNINFTSNNESFTSMVFITSHGGDINSIDYGNTTVWYSDIDGGEYWSLSQYQEFEITGGTDVTDSTLIGWIEANATQVVEPAASTYTLTNSLTNLTHGNITLQLTADSDYELPDTITVTDGTLVSYDKTTGVAVISGDDNTSVSVECSAVISGYTLKIIDVQRAVKIWYANGTYTTGNGTGSYTGVEAFMVSGWIGPVLSSGSIEYNGTTLTGYADFNQDTKYTLLTDCKIENVMN